MSHLWIREEYQPRDLKYGLWTLDCNLDDGVGLIYIMIH